MIWARVSSKNPCPICRKADWCAFGDRAMKCMRVASQHPSKDGGFYHFYDVARPDFLPTIQRDQAQPVNIDAGKLHAGWQSKTMPHQIVMLAGQLKVAPRALWSLGVAWGEMHCGRSIRAYAFPMKDGDGNIVGIRLRNKIGFKWAITGSREGIFVPNIDSALSAERVAYLPEGPTDTAAGISMGLLTIGRPTCRTGLEQIKKTLGRLKIYKAVIIADNDEMKQFAGRDGRPGIEGAQKLKAELGLTSVIWTPPSPIKDLREFYGKGGTRSVIESQLKNKVWTHK